MSLASQQKINLNKKTHAAVTRGGSVLSRYQTVIVGQESFMFLLYFEWCVLLSRVPGAIGLFLRKLFWPKLFGSCGKGVVFSDNVVLRHPNRIHIGERTVISEGCILDARNDELQQVLVLEEDIILSSNVMISCKGGSVKIGARTGIGAQSIIQSTNNCPVSIGKDVIIGPRCYIVGGGTYNIDRLDIPMWQQGVKQDGGVILEDDIWLGANVTVVGGVKMQSGSVAAAGAVVVKPVIGKAIVGGIPAKVLKYRSKS